jgi:hypothetical protein
LQAQLCPDPAAECLGLWKSGPDQDGEESGQAENARAPACRKLGKPRGPVNEGKFSGQRTARVRQRGPQKKVYEQTNRRTPLYRTGRFRDIVVTWLSIFVIAKASFAVVLFGWTAEALATSPAFAT